MCLLHLPFLLPFYFFLSHSLHVTHNLIESLLWPQTIFVTIPSGHFATNSFQCISFLSFELFYLISAFYHLFSLADSFLFLHFPPFHFLGVSLVTYVCVCVCIQSWIFLTQSIFWVWWKAAHLAYRILVPDQGLNPGSQTPREFPNLYFNTLVSCFHLLSSLALLGMFLPSCFVFSVWNVF